MPVKEIDHIVVQFDGARLSDLHESTEGTKLTLVYNHDSGSLAIHETDQDEQRTVAIYAPGAWASVRPYWKDQD